MTTHLERTNQGTAKSIECNGDSKLAQFIGIYVLASSCNIAVKTIFPISASIWDMVSVVFGIIILVFFARAVPVLWFRASGVILLVELSFLTLFAFSLLMGNADIAMLTSIGFWTFCICVPLGVAGVSIHDKAILYDSLWKVSVIEYPVLCIALFSMYRQGTYSMPVSYSLVMPVTFLYHRFFSKKSLISLALAVVASLLILVFGARGPLLCIVYYCLAKMFVTERSQSCARNLLVKLLFLSLAIIVLLFCWNSILSYVASSLKASGVKSYAISSLLDGSFAQSSARQKLWDYYFMLIKDKPFSGYGVLGGWISAEQHPHNMLIEFVLAFGLLFGSIVSLSSLMLFLRFVKTDGTILSELMLILSACIFTLFTVSGDWLENPMFFLFIFLAIQIVIGKNKGSVISKSKWMQ